MALIICKKCKNRGKACEYSAEYTCDILSSAMRFANLNNSRYSKLKKEEKIEFDYNFICKSFEEVEKNNAE